ncbi:hypothetical protein PROFUN_09459 [Planoprotostelium fungivorum]|uniref:Uncharacterized protein n=1 Tax=Planoprotostelium fungivorum TaxID=1890364 RepID=A0A2P6NH20_9EUKA|nr:hypothetical protein PROFUN_09459 [Planoprotostelium fungivorum]
MAWDIFLCERTVDDTDSRLEMNLRKDEDEPTLGWTCCYLENARRVLLNGGIRTQTWNRVRMRETSTNAYLCVVSGKTAQPALTPWQKGSGDER